MVLQRLLGDLPKEEFLDRYFLQCPFSRSAGAQEFAGLGSWETLDAILASEPGIATLPVAEAPDVLVVRRGERWREKDRPSAEEARTLHAAGYTIVLRNSERRHPELARLADGFHRDFLAPIDIQLYYTPAGQFGFGWHYDPEDVFVIQAAGTKEYTLRKNSVNPWPTKETLPRDMRFEREVTPLLRCRLSAGDWLYIPGGYWHRADAGQDSISLAVGVLTPTALDVFDFLRSRLLSSLLWRQRLPVPGSSTTATPNDLRETLGRLFAELGRDLQGRFEELPLIDEYLDSLKRSSGLPATHDG